jgi:phospholipase C
MKRILALQLVLVLGLALTMGSRKATYATGTSKIQHLIFIIQENHSFDNYFGTYPGAIGLPSGISVPFNINNIGRGYLAPYHLNITEPILIVGDELPPGISDPSQLNQTLSPDPGDVGSGTVGPFPFNNESIAGDLSHAWTVAHIDYDNGKMDGFVTGEKSTKTMGYYDRSDIPYYWDYADQYVLDDNFFSSEMGPSFPNHLYIASGANGPTNLTYRWILNGGIVDNVAPTYDWKDMHLDWSTLAEELSGTNISWAWYDGDTRPLAPTIWNVLPLFTYFQAHPKELSAHVANTQQFISDTHSGNLPAVSWIIPGAWHPPDYPAVCARQSPSEHPPARSDCGMDYVSYLVNQVMQSQYWQSTAIIITWDDYGGFYDHVPPPKIDQYGEGFRVPTLVVSPWVKHHFIDHTEYEFASLLRLTEDNFQIPTLGQRDSQANDMMNSFDFNQAPQPTLMEPATFVGPAAVSTTATGTSASTAVSNPAQTTVQTPTSWPISGFSPIAIILGLTFGGLLIALRKRRGAEQRSNLGLSMNPST